MRRLVGGLVRSTGDMKHDCRKEAVAAARVAVISGAKLQRAVEITNAQEEWLRQTVRATHLAAEVWRRRVTQGGPARAAVLREAERTMALVAVRAVKEGAASRLSRATYVNSTSTRAETRRLAWLGVDAGGLDSATAELQRLHCTTWDAARESVPAEVSTVWWDARAAAYVCGRSDVSPASSRRRSRGAVRTRRTTGGPRGRGGGLSPPAPPHAIV